MKTEKTILEEQSEIEAALDHLPALAAQLPAALKPLVRLSPRKGFRVQVSLRRGNAKDSRQVKQNAPASRWLPDSGLVAIMYRPSTPEEDQAAESTVEDVQDSLAKPAETAPKPAETASDPVQDIVMALARAEKDPQLGFVSLKWFRDTYLPQQGYPWAAIPDERQRVLVNAIDRNWILTSRVANPKNPQFPVTAIKVNRPLSEVHSILEQEPGPRSGFNPVAMRGEPLSQTVLRERR
jgi:hypothetical protein